MPGETEIQRFKKRQRVVHRGSTEVAVVLEIFRSWVKIAYPHLTPEWAHQNGLRPAPSEPLLKESTVTKLSDVQNGTTVTITIDVIVDDCASDRTRKDTTTYVRNAGGGKIFGVRDSHVLSLKVKTEPLPTVGGSIIKDTYTNKLFVRTDDGQWIGIQSGLKQDVGYIAALPFEIVHVPVG